MRNRGAVARRPVHDILITGPSASSTAVTTRPALLSSKRLATARRVGR